MSQQFDPRYLYTYSVYAVHPDGRSGSTEKNKRSGPRVGLFVRRKRDGSYEKLGSGSSEAGAIWEAINPGVKPASKL
jgi:hypothetical protein